MEIKQFAESVVNFSSQYGTAGSSSYTASNLAGSLRVYDRYGDFTEAFVLRSYGPWWQMCPSASRKLKKASEAFRSQDFVELSYNTAVFPTGINIYETYHPGAVVRILACNSSDPDKKVDPKKGDPEKEKKSGEVEWVTLWSGPPQCSQIPKASRKFSPPLKKIDFPTNLIRLEFNSVECDYYTELDGVELRGTEPTRLQSFKDRAKGFQVQLTARLLRQLSLSDRQVSIGSEDDDEFDKWGYFGMLPDEIIQYIFQYLDLVSLAKAAQSCSLLLKHAYDPLLYSGIDLQSHWNTVDDVALEGLQSHCESLRHLNLSWTGGGGQITESALCSFLEECGSELLTLRLSCCRYIGETTLTTIARVCTKLEELDLQSCLHLEEEALLLIGQLSRLKRLNLYCTHVTEPVLKAIGQCTQLEHLNLGAMPRTVDPSSYPLKSSGQDSQTAALNECLRNLKNLVSLDLWRCSFATTDTLFTLSKNCPNLEELDIGWCHKIYGGRYGIGFAAEPFCKGCPRLKKLFLTCGRSINDDNLIAIAKYCKDLEQLDILGTNAVTEVGASEILRCTKLKFFDLSFCSRLSNEVVDDLKKKFPRVCFKKSFN